MRKLFYALTFAAVFLLAGSAGLASFDEPSGGGTVPDGEYRMWLPVVGNTPPWWTAWIYHSECPYPELINPPILEVGRNEELYVSTGPIYFEFRVANECDLGGPEYLKAGLEVHDFTQGLGSSYFTYGIWASEANRYFVHFEPAFTLEPGKTYHIAMAYEDGSPNNPGPFRGIVGTIIFAR